MAEKSQLKEFLNYQPEEYLTDAEKTLLKQTFYNNDRLLKLLRKLLLPTVTDADLPIEQMGKDVYFTGRDWANIPADEAKILMTARQEAVKFVLGGLIEIKVIANTREETETEKAARKIMDSSK